MAKRNAKGAGMIRKRSDGRWEGRYTLNGARKAIYGKTQAIVRKKLTEIIADVDKGVFTEPSKLSVGKWLDIWISEYLADVKPSTIDQYRYQINTHLKPRLGNVKLNELTAPMVQHLYNTLRNPYQITQKVANGKTKKVQKNGLSAKSIRNMNSVLHESLDKALKLGYIHVNVCDAVTLPRVQKKEMNVITGENVKRFLEVIKGNPYEELFYITMFTGLREGECLGLTWDCIDFENKTITIYRQLQKERKKNGQYIFVPLKNSKSRAFMIPDDIKAVLQQIKRKQAADRLLVGDAWENKDGFVFTDCLGRHLSKSTVYNNFKRCASMAGIPETRFHDLRHTYATLAIQQKIDIKTVSANLGHATVSFTLDVYGHVSEQMQKDSADRMQAYLDAL